MSFLEDAPASADVVARENSLLLRVPQEAIRIRTTERPGFAASFFQAVSLLMAERLRTSTGALLQHLDREQAAALPTRTTTHHHELQERIARAKELLHDTDRLALKNQGVIPDARVALVREQFSALVVELNRHLGEASSLDLVTREALGRWVQGELLPYIHVSRVAERMYAKPRGYAGDFLTIEYLYEDRGEGTGRLGPLIDRCFLDQPAARAVRNRRGLLKEELIAAVEGHPDRTTRVTSLASGPAAEIFDVFDTLQTPEHLAATCIDIDAKALAYVQHKRDPLGLQSQMRLERANLVYLATGRAKLDLPPQDVVYSIGLIDYFNDQFVVGLLNYIHGLLAPGGQVILGNFHPRNTSRGLMDHVLDWQLIHRDEADMHRLFSSSAFGARCERIRFEAEGINLFAFGRKR